MLYENDNNVINEFISGSLFTSENIDIESEHKNIVGGHLLRNIMMLPCNAHEVSELALNLSNPAMSVTEELAAGIFPVLSLVNHSCNPSLVRHSYGRQIEGRAQRKITSGEELLDNYGALYPTSSKEERQNHLKAQYHFLCGCQACQDDWPQYFDIP